MHCEISNSVVRFNKFLTCLQVEHSALAIAVYQRRGEVGWNAVHGGSNSEFKSQTTTLLS